MEFTAAADEAVPVLIVGGGGAGLTASMLLARQGVDHLLVSARPGTSDLPKAHVLNLRAIEVLEDVGVAAAIAERGTPAEQMAATAYYAGFAGPDPDYGRRLARLECWGAGGEDELWRAESPWRQMTLPQIRLEPLLKARAEEFSPGRIRFGHELIDLEQDEDGVRALVRENASGREYVVKSDYLLGADGGRRVARLIGVEYEGLGVVTQTATLHVSADVSRWAKDPDVLIRWIYSPQAGVLVVMVPMGPERWGPESEEWVIHLNYPVDCEESDAQVEADARQALGIADLPMKIHKITRCRSVFQALEDRFECWLLNAHHLRNVPGRKTDVKDSEWICQLVQHGLVRPSFVPPPEIRRLRDLTRLRTAQNNERTRTIQRLEKVLQDAGIKISSVASTSYSKSARTMLEALLSGVTDPEQLAELSKGKMRAKIPRLREALQSRFAIEHHGVMVAQLLAHIDTLDTELQHLTERIEFVLSPHAHIVELLRTIPGVQAQAAQILIAECGLDMNVFPTVGHFASWAGACPGHHQSAGRRKSGRTRPGPGWLTSQLTECARAAVRTKNTYLASHFAQLRGRRGEQKAIGAIRHDLLVAYYHIVRDQVPYRDLGPDWQRKRYSVEHRARRLQRQLEALGYAVTLDKVETEQQAA